MRRHRVDNRVAHKSTGGVLPWTPQPVDPVGNPVPLTPNTVALPSWGEAKKELRTTLLPALSYAARNDYD